MTQPKFAGIALGGIAAGEMIENFRPIKEMRPKTVILGTKQPQETYYYVPYFGMQGFWIAESETKGRNPYDDILRILSEFYVNSHRAGVTHGSGGSINLPSPIAKDSR